MTISIDVEKKFEKIQRPFMIKTQETRNRGELPQLGKKQLQTFCTKSRLIVKN